MNDVYLKGRLGRDPELRYTGSGDPVVNFPMATSKKWKDKNNQWQEKTQWHNIEAWGPTAERIHRQMTKGDLVFIKGELLYKEYDKNGERRFATSIRSFLVEKLETATMQAQQQPQQPQADDDYTEDDIPF